MKSFPSCKEGLRPGIRSDTRFVAASLLALGSLGVALALGGCVAVPALVVTGMGSAAYVANDRRTNETMLSDQRIQKTASSRLEANLKNDIRIDAISYNRSVLLIGEARSDEIKERAAKIVAGVDGVHDVYNEVQVTDKLGFRSVASDAGVSAQVKARLVGSGFSNPTNVHVSTDNGVVYLMGLVTHKEADEASHIAATTSGVRRVVRVFEYIPDSAVPAKTGTSADEAKAPK
jgi:osmotically-inducible protein OsmY